MELDFIGIIETLASYYFYWEITRALDLYQGALLSQHTVSGLEEKRHVDEIQREKKLLQQIPPITCCMNVGVGSTYSVSDPHQEPFNGSWKVFLDSAEEEMPISHKIRQYRASLRFADPGETLQSPEQQKEVSGKQGIWRGFRHQILIGSPRGLGIGLLELSRNPSLVVPWFDVSRLFRVVVPAAILSYPAHPDISRQLCSSDRRGFYKT